MNIGLTYLRIHDFDADPSDDTKFVYHLAASLSTSVKSIISDGEICAWSVDNETIVQKSQQNNIRKLTIYHPVYNSALCTTFVT